MIFLVVLSTALFMLASYDLGRIRARADKSDFHGGHAGVWIWGAFLVAFLSWIAMLLFSAIQCAPKREASGHLTLCTSGVFCDATEHWFLVLTEWQSGIGAAVGLLGVAWAAFYKSVYGEGG